LEQFPQKNGGQVILPDDVRSFGPGENINRYLARVTKSLIETTLKQCDGNISQAALRLGLHRNTMKFRLATANQILAEAA
ncbi:MAG: helix-turn-helix domain-containing protein, partial [Pyrinomonadaceae bacterium]